MISYNLGESIKVYEQWKVNSKKSKELYDKIYEQSETIYMRDSTYANLMIELENALEYNKISKEEYESLAGVIAKCCNENSLELENQTRVREQAKEDAKKRWKEKNALWRFFHRKEKPTAKMNRMSDEEINRLCR